MINQSFKNSNKPLIIAVILLLPLFWINMSGSHDWGGDFAMYILQAKNLVNGIPQSDTGYIYNPDFARNGPPNYPIGFPVILSPIYAIWGNSMVAFSFFQTFLGFIFGLTLFAFLRKHVSWITSLMLVLILIYNPWFLYFKQEIMSEFPFTILLLLFLMGLRSSKSFVLLWALGTTVILMRGVGWVIIPMLVIPPLLTLLFRKIGKPELWSKVKLSLAIVITVIGLNRLLFDVPMTAETYSDQLVPTDILANAQGNFTYFKEVMKDHLFRYIEKRGFTGDIPIIIFGILCFIGGVRAYKINPHYPWLIILYTAILLFYPYRFSGFRFLFPIQGVLLMFMAIGARSAFPKLIQQNVAIILATGIYLSSFIEPYKNIIQHQDKVQQGPQHSLAKETFQFIRNNVSNTETILFIKPRVLALYTGIGAVSNEPFCEYSAIEKLVESHKVNYFLLNTVAANPSLETYIRDEKNGLYEVMKNDQFTLLKNN